jgi:serine/threonine protein kinase
MLICPKCSLRLPNGQTICPLDGIQVSAVVSTPVAVEHSAPMRNVAAGASLVAGGSLPSDGGDGRSPFAEEEDTIRRLGAFDLDAGTLVGEYEIIEKIGEGGMGSVYAGVQPLIGKRVAIKVLSSEVATDPRAVKRFIGEARAVNEIRHRNIIDIFSFGQLVDGRYYFVMELLSGLPLNALTAREGAMPLERLLPLLQQICVALDAVHSRGIIHRDLKPDNIFVCDDEASKPLVKLLDFGIAKLRPDEGEKLGLTRPGRPIGTPFYMSPEQCRGREVDLRADVYSLGIVVYQLLTGKLPFFADSPLEVFHQHLTKVPTPPSTWLQLPAAVAAQVDATVLAAIAKQPAERPASAGSVWAGLERAALAGAHSSRGGLGDSDELPDSARRAPSVQPLDVMELQATTPFLTSIPHPILDTDPTQQVDRVGGAPAVGYHAATLAALEAYATGGPTVPASRVPAIAVRRQDDTSDAITIVPEPGSNGMGSVGVYVAFDEQPTGANPLVGEAMSAANTPAAFDRDHLTGLIRRDGDEAAGGWWGRQLARWRPLRSAIEVVGIALAIAIVVLVLSGLVMRR